MSTPRLPFYEKDAVRWRDTVAAMMYELNDIKRCCNLPSIAYRVEDQIRQCILLADDIQETIDKRKAK